MRAMYAGTNVYTERYATRPAWALLTNCAGPEAVGRAVPSCVPCDLARGGRRRG